MYIRKIQCVNLAVNYKMFFKRTRKSLHIWAVRKQITQEQYFILFFTLYFYLKKKKEKKTLKYIIKEIKLFCPY